MNYKIKTLIGRTVLLSLLFITSLFAAPLHQECDGKKKTCCFAHEMESVPPMWVNADACPKGMVDDATCPVQYGCTAESVPTPK